MEFTMIINMSSLICKLSIFIQRKGDKVLILLPKCNNSNIDLTNPSELKSIVDASVNGLNELLSQQCKELEPYSNSQIKDIEHFNDDFYIIGSVETKQIDNEYQPLYSNILTFRNINYKYSLDPRINLVNAVNSSRKRKLCNVLVSNTEPKGYYVQNSSSTYVQIFSSDKHLWYSKCSVKTFFNRINLFPLGNIPRTSSVISFNLVAKLKILELVNGLFFPKDICIVKKNNNKEFLFVLDQKYNFLFDRFESNIDFTSKKPLTQKTKNLYINQCLNSFDLRNETLNLIPYEEWRDYSLEIVNPEELEESNLIFKGDLDKYKELRQSNFRLCNVSSGAYKYYGVDRVI